MPKPALVADDSTSLRGVIGIALKGAGYQANIFGGGNIHPCRIDADIGQVERQPIGDKNAAPPLYNLNNQL